VDGLVGYHSFRGFKIKLCDTLLFFVICNYVLSLYKIAEGVKICNPINFEHRYYNVEDIKPRM